MKTKITLLALLLLCATLLMQEAQGQSTALNNDYDASYYLGWSSTFYQPIPFKIGPDDVGRIDWNGPVFFGTRAGKFNIALNNIGIGWETLLNNSTGDNNIALGRQTLWGNNGTCNIGIGSSTLGMNTGGSYNTAVGHSALLYNVANYNTALGYLAGASNSLNASRTGTNNTFMGANSGLGAPWSNGVSNATAIGANALATESNQVMLGDINTVTSLFCMGAYVPTTTDRPNLVVLSTGQILRSTTGAPWLLNGNSGTIDDINMTGEFLGTTDDVALSFRVNNERAGRIESAQHHTTSFGYQALKPNPPNPSYTPGSYNDAFGYQALFSNTEGSDNTAIGEIALYHNTVGHDNTGTGYRALYTNNGSWNTANGASALFCNTTGNANTAYGAGALLTNTGGSYNTANGVWALFLNTTGNRNTANGSYSLNKNTTGENNSAFGSNSLSSNINGNYNTAIGSDALLTNTTGHDNTANGYTSLYYNTSGCGNTAHGSAALFENTTGNNNTANGIEALYENTSGGNNTANGFQALFNNMTGSNNTANGSSSLFNNTSGYANTAVGGNALISNSTGNHNTAIGYYAGVSATSNLTNATAIGSNALVKTSNSIVLGSISGLNGATSDVYVGIGKPDPTHNLEVVGTSWVTGGLWGNSDSLVKQDINAISNALSTIHQLDPVSFDFKVNEFPYMNLPAGNQFGFLAQEVETVLPNLIDSIHFLEEKDSSGNVVIPDITFKGLNYIGLIPIAIAGIQELDSIVTNLDTSGIKKSCPLSKNFLTKSTGIDSICNSQIYDNGVGVGVGTDVVPAGYKMVVEGKLGARDVIVACPPSWPDYVFDSEHSLPPLEEVDNYVTTNRHLPGIPSQNEIEKAGGLNLGVMQTSQMEKIEELYLYIIDMNKNMQKLNLENQELKDRVKILENK